MFMKLFYIQLVAVPQGAYTGPWMASENIAMVSAIGLFYYTCSLKKYISE